MALSVSLTAFPVALMSQGMTSAGNLLKLRPWVHSDPFLQFIPQHIPSDPSGEDVRDIFDLFAKALAFFTDFLLTLLLPHPLARLIILKPGWSLALRQAQSPSVF